MINQFILVVTDGREHLCYSVCETTTLEDLNRWTREQFSLDADFHFFLEYVREGSQRHLIRKRSHLLFLLCHALTTAPDLVCARIVPATRVPLATTGSVLPRTPPAEPTSSGPPHIPVYQSSAGYFNFAISPVPALSHAPSQASLLSDQGRYPSSDKNGINTPRVSVPSRKRMRSPSPVGAKSMSDSQKARLASSIRASKMLDSLLDPPTPTPDALPSPMPMHDGFMSRSTTVEILSPARTSPPAFKRRRATEDPGGVLRTVARNGLAKEGRAVVVSASKSSPLTPMCSSQEIVPDSEPARLAMPDDSFGEQGGYHLHSSASMDASSSPGLTALPGHGGQADIDDAASATSQEFVVPRGPTRFLVLDDVWFGRSHVGPRFKFTFALSSSCLALICAFGSYDAVMVPLNTIRVVGVDMEAGMATVITDTLPHIEIVPGAPDATWVVPGKAFTLDMHSRRSDLVTLRDALLEFGVKVVLPPGA
ncbi:hypothetical protein PENSPDRAFT_748118 [Peniophora sp. CONT]|nr:hypothetical protein PENSPDRAFT_748118 [Peniophora sp. CONT]